MPHYSPNQFLPCAAILLLTCVNTLSADLVVVDVHSTGTIGSLADADALLAGTGVSSQTTVVAGFIDYLDADGGGGTGNFGNNFAFPNNNVGVDDNDFAINASGQVFIPTAGNWTFGVSSDDGSRLNIGGSNIIVDDTLHAVQDTFGTVNLSAGWHSLEFVFFERGGGAGVELFASEGSFSSFAGNNFQLVGDTSNGGLLTRISAAVPEPSALSLMTVVGLGLLRRRRRRQT